MGGREVLLIIPEEPLPWLLKPALPAPEPLGPPALWFESTGNEYSASSTSGSKL
jgi:hypothetical protein